MPGVHTTIQRGIALARVAVITARRVPRRTAGVLRAGAFWLAIVLPIVYLPLLFVDAAWAVALVMGLLVVHILSVLVGNGHRPRS